MGDRADSPHISVLWAGSLVRYQNRLVWLESSLKQMVENYFEDITTVFRDRSILEIDYVVDQTRIIGRDEELKALAQSLHAATKGNTPSNCLIYGKPGTGKSLSAKFISRQLTETAESNGHSVGTAYIDCSECKSETDTIISIGQKLNDPDLSGVTIPDTGLSTAKYYKRLWTILNERYDTGIVILDEIDRLSDVDSVLMKLSRAGESRKIPDSSLGIIGISNKPRFHTQLNERTKSSLNERRHVFPAYTADQLIEILEARKDAFKPETVNEDVIPRTAAVSAREYGDARKAVDIFRYTGEIANRNESEVVKSAYVSEAVERAERDEIIEVISTLPYHSTLVLQSAAALAVDKQGSNDVVTTRETYSLYEQKCSMEETSPVSERRVRDLLDEAEFLEILQRTKRSAGKSHGSYTVIEFIDQPDKVLQACKSIESTG